MVHPDELAAIAGAVVLASGVTATWWVRRLARRLRAQLRSQLPTRLPAAWSGRARLTYLQARQFGSLGPTRELLAMRVGLGRAVAAAIGTVAEARAAGAPVGELPELARRVEALAGRADRELALLQAEPVGITRTAEFTERVAAADTQIRHLLQLAAQLGGAARDALHGITAPELAELTADVERERSAIADGLAHLRRLARP